MIKDVLDKKILNLLQQNCRLPYAQIGRKIGLSSSAVAERIQRLEDDQVIQGYTAVINPRKVGFHLSAYVSIRLKEKSENFFLRDIDKFPEIIECSRITGDDCLMMRVQLRDIEHLDQLIDRLSDYGAPCTSVVLSDIIVKRLVDIK